MRTAHVPSRNTMGGSRPRNTDDGYFTPLPLAEAICRRLFETVSAVDEVIEPSAGAGAFVRAARCTWPTATIRAVEPNAGAKKDLVDAGANSVERATWEDSRALEGVGRLERRILVVGNPPFLLGEEHVRIALNRMGHSPTTGPRPRWLAFLLRASFLAGDRRSRGLHMSVGGLRYVWHIAGRPSFTGDGKRDGAEYAVLVWQAGFSGPFEGGWLTWRGD